MFGDGEVLVSHIQYADDTLITGTKSWKNVWAIKAILQLFELVSGLKVNFYKSCLIGINIYEVWLVEVEFVLNRKVGGTPFKYLGIPVGGNHRNLSLWKGVIDAISKSEVTQVETIKHLAVAWNCLISLKISILAWRVWQNRLLTRDNLVKRDILDESQNSCPFDCAKEENISHIFFECPSTLATWSEIFRWLGFMFAMHNSSWQNFVQFAGITQRGSVFKERSAIFDIQAGSWRWLKPKIKRFSFNLFHWISNPKVCIGWTD
ncbi:unnamed protein product [Vicia faba]|uniref:Reverse transcriptase zinc-binding domain-containing protein n=1 Tax=Vicia faba TaxID=3906 RepID=A0AAV1ADE1_VICFA|nr:unnamed protein product [Vicia faba]